MSARKLYGCPVVETDDLPTVQHVTFDDPADWAAYWANVTAAFEEVGRQIAVQLAPVMAALGGLGLALQREQLHQRLLAWRVPARWATWLAARWPRQLLPAFRYECSGRVE